MLNLSVPAVRSYSIAVFAVALALIITANVDLLAGRTPLFFAAVIVATWNGGRTAGLFALALSAVTAAYFILPPQNSFDLDAASVFQLGTFVAVALPISWMMAALRERERALSISEARYRFLFDNNPFAMWVFDSETLSFLAVNEAATTSYGYSKDEFLEMTLKDIRPAEDVPGLLRHLAGNVPRIEPVLPWRHVKKDGTVIDVETSSHALTFEGRPARLVLANNVTERLKAEEAVRQSEARLQTIVENLTEGLAVADLHGNLLHFNLAALAMHGFDKQEDSQRHLKQFGEIFELSDLDGIVLPLYGWPLARILRGESIRNVELRVRRKDREFERIFNFGGTLIQDPDEVPLMAIVTISDITERKAAEASIRMLNDTLEKRVLERTAELAAANSELEAFSYSVSHDLRAPLRHLSGFSQALLEEYSDKLDQTGQGYLNQVRDASHEMAHLIDDVLELARVTRAGMHREDFDLSQLAGELFEEIKKRDPARSVNITIEDGLAAYGDRRLVGVVLANLLENAWKFTANRPVAEIVLGRDRSNGEHGYFIRDNGAGFDMAYADKLYGAFQRLHSVSEFEGTGIGLATVRRIINRHGGHIRAEGVVGKGAAFYFTLPDYREGEHEEQSDLTGGGQSTG